MAVYQPTKTACRERPGIPDYSANRQIAKTIAQRAHARALANDPHDVPWWRRLEGEIVYALDAAQRG